MKIFWKGKGRTREYGNLSIPITEDLEIDKQWNGHGSHPAAWIENGRLYVMVKRYYKKEAKDEQGKVQEAMENPIKQ